MAFAIRNLSVLAYANGFTHWHYKSKDTLEEIKAPNYMADAGDILTKNDILFVTGSDGTTMLVVTLADVETVILGPMK